jgi:hypothetical protein
MSALGQAVAEGVKIKWLSTVNNSGKTRYWSRYAIWAGEARSPHGTGRSATKKGEASCPAVDRPPAKPRPTQPRSAGQFGR